jgi:hypothetical protein
MKTHAVLGAILLSFASVCNAHGHGHRGYGWGWVAPAIIGGVVTYEVTRPTVVLPPTPTVVTVQPTVPVCGGWVEVRNPDGTITQTRTCSQ